jgi:hypothetical protein
MSVDPRNWSRRRCVRIGSAVGELLGLQPDDRYRAGLLVLCRFCEVLMMSIDQADTIDFATIDKVTGDLWLTISDHLPWDENEGSHLAFLQTKINAYLRFVESGEVFKKFLGAEGRSIVISLVGKFQLSQNADRFSGRRVVR